jgi:hypothetical protein
LEDAEIAEAVPVEEAEEEGVEEIEAVEAAEPVEAEVAETEEAIPEPEFELSTDGLEDLDDLSLDVHEVEIPEEISASTTAEEVAAEAAPEMETAEPAAVEAVVAVPAELPDLDIPEMPTEGAMEIPDLEELLETADLSKCPVCGSQIGDEDISCPNCSVELFECPECGSIVTPQDTACSNCGVALESPEGEEEALVSTPGMANGVAPSGLTNGLGRTNGITNGLGRTNGLTNGLGRTNGLTNGLGRTNGLTNGLGRTNGLTNGLGRTNGLTNGVRRPVQRGKIRRRDTVKKEITILAIVVIFMLSGLGTIVFMNPPELPTEGGILMNDATFDDWEGILMYDDSPTDQLTPSINIQEFAMDYSHEKLSFYVQTGGNLFEDYISETIRIFIDNDLDSLTGYNLKGIGADNMIVITGSDDKINNARLHEFNSEKALTNSDMNGWDVITSLRAHYEGSEIEFQLKGPAAIDLINPGDGARAIFSTVSSGEYDFSDYAITIESGALVISQQSTVQNQLTIPSSDNPYMSLTMNAHGETVSLTSLTLKKAAQSTASDTMIASVNVYSDSTLTTQVGTGVLSNGKAVINMDSPVTMTVGTANMLYVGITIAADVSGQGRTIAMDTVDAGLSRGVASVNILSRPNAYLGQPGSNIVIDGLFEDWSSYTMFTDPAFDANPNGDPNERSIDITNYNAVTEQVGGVRTSSFYVEVADNIMSGTDMPIETTQSVSLNIRGVNVIPAPSYADVTWTTTMPADSIVRYGTTQTLELQAAPSPNNEVESHSVRLSGLQPDTSYYFQVTSTTTRLSPQTVSSSIQTFRTAVSGLPPTIIFGPTTMLTPSDQSRSHN